MTISAETIRRRMKVIEENYEEWTDQDSWGGSNSKDDLAATRFAVVIKREDDSWVIYANDDADIARIELATLTGGDDV